MDRFKSIPTLLFKFRNRIIIGSIFTSSYLGLCYQAQNGMKNDILRMAVAGSLANSMVETSFHFLDTVNVRTKLSSHNRSMLSTFKHIYSKEGIHGFVKGFSACYYGSIICGFVYFGLYKVLKKSISDFLGPDYNIAWSLAFASGLSEFLTLLIYYPYDLIKCRLQTKNHIFKYKNLVHAYRKEIFGRDKKSFNVLPLYSGSFPFLVTYCTMVCI